MIEVLSVLAVAGGLLVGRWVAARHQKKEAAALPPSPGALPSLEAPAPADERTDDARPEADEPIDWSAFPCALGDVVMRAHDGAEAWLAGAIVFSEDAPAAVLFVGPDAAGERAIYVRPRPRAELAWLAPVRGDALLSGGDPPSVIEIEGLSFERRRRLPFRAQRLGTGAPDVGETAVVGEYAAASGEVAVLLISDGVSRAWTGRRLGEGEYEVWNGEKTGG
jgi:hypothetical protein